MQKTLLSVTLTTILSLGCLAPASAQVYTGNLKLVYSSETPEAAATSMGRDLTDAEKSACTGDFVSEENMLRNWEYTERQGSYWNKRIAQSDEDRRAVNQFDGAYHSYAKQNATEWITGAIQMKTDKANELGAFGVIEVKAKTNPFASNWTGIWMMPTSGEPWPNGGELDIVEEVGSGGELWTVMHMEARDGKTPDGGSDPVASEASTALKNKYTWYTSSSEYKGGEHIYSLRWTKDYVHIFVDGKSFFKYSKDYTLDFAAHPTYEHAQYPYDSPFYLILNQSVGYNASWAKVEPTSGHTYQTDIDYVRIYKSPEQAPCVTTLEEGVEYAIQEEATGLYAANAYPEGSTKTTDTQISLSTTPTPFTLVKNDKTWYIQNKDGQYLKIRSTNKGALFTTAASTAQKWYISYSEGTGTYQIHVSNTATSTGWGVSEALPGKGVFLNLTGGLWRIYKYSDIETSINDLIADETAQNSAQSVRKTIKDGRLIIVHDGKTYGIDGRLVR